MPTHCIWCKIFQSDTIIILTKRYKISYKMDARIISAALVLATLCVGLTGCLAEHSILDQLLWTLKPEDRLAPLEEAGAPGYDFYTDAFYTSGNIKSIGSSRIAEAHARNPERTRIYLAGQAVDSDGRQVQPAAHPFAAAQLTLLEAGVNADRWDVKGRASGAQYLGMYHGVNGDFVANNLRAYLTRWIASKIHDYLPVLDRSQSEFKEKEAEIKAEMKRLIQERSRHVDGMIEDLVKERPELGQVAATATVVVVSESHLIVSNVGAGRVLAYDSAGDVWDLTLKPEGSEEEGEILFGRAGQSPLAPFVQFVPRQLTDANGVVKKIQLLLVGTPAVAKNLDIGESAQIMGQIKAGCRDEQEFYEKSVYQLLANVEAKMSAEAKAQEPDLSVAIVGLDLN